MRVSRFVSLAALGLLIVAALGLWLTLRASLPQLDGEVAGAGVAAPVAIERDAAGSPTVRASSRRDAAFALGFAHAQDRFFQMDLQRRAASGRLAALLGAAAVDSDRRLRVHDFAHVAAQVVTNASPPERELLDAYTQGVNFALAHARARPWEYAVLRAKPEAWRATDCVLVAYSMFLNLNDSTGNEELARTQLHDVLPPALYAFMYPLGTGWDAPILGSTWRAGATPGPEVLDLRSGPARTSALAAPPLADLAADPPMVGSNSWAIAGTHAVDGHALLANDMHLTLRLPHVWYHARLIVEAPGDAHRDLVGVTLPGLPVLIAGSNGRVAWGYTNSYGDWTDVVAVDVDPANPDAYLTAEGSVAFGQRHEIIAVRGGEPIALDVRTTQWGPIVNQDATGRPLVLAWTAHRERAMNVRLSQFESATTVEELLAIANEAGGPVQNVLAADDRGHIGWSLMGQVPRRANYDSTLVSSRRAADTGWVGWRAPEEYPRVIDPPAGRLWTANARTIDTETWLAFLGDGGYDLGARAAQIRDDLFALPTAGSADLAKVQVDDRALFLARWRDLLLELLDANALAGHALRADARPFIEKWSARAAADDVGYRLVHAFRVEVRKDVFAALTAGARQKFPKARFAPGAQFEGPLWQLVTERPAHLLDPKYKRWEDALLASFDAALAALPEECRELARCTWGRENALAMRHPLSGALPFAAHWLDMPVTPMPGDSNMPRAQGPAFGASERLVVSPGREDEGLFQMPGGPVDHPLSPFYGAGHAAWVRGEARPLRPGAKAHELRLNPTS